MLENYALMQPNNNNLILQVNGASTHFTCIFCDYLKVNI
jgi:hypothetical protein